MSIREEVLYHFVTVTTPATVTDTYGNEALSWDPDDGATEATIRGWVQQQTANEEQTTSGDRLVSGWLLITNDPVDALDRITWNSDTYTVEGQPAPMHSRTGIHHYETVLRQVEG